MADFPNKVRLLERQWKHRLKIYLATISYVGSSSKAIICTIEFLYFENISRKVII